ncbi:MAG: DUF4105 domain-containing protein [Leptospiraceae bacterium]|nr:DUF4105 domain-containing protein [Leptospiraceae bacterium]MCP5510973.1 DUF4105 domain-containing protein [Leptospiraceae bacterium]
MIRLIIFFSFSFIISLSSIHAQDIEYAQELILEANRRELYKDEYWLKLIHYVQKRNGYEGEADNTQFYFSIEGKHSPQKEMESTILSFFQEDPSVNEDLQMQPQCAFPARFHYLSKKLSFDPERLRFRPCDKLRTWEKALDVESITVVFTSYYLSSPASMMGHTLFKLNSRKNKETELLDYGVNYAALTDETNPFLYAYNGLVGGYVGGFAIYPYYMKVNEYNDMESRDIWEYELNLEGEEINLFMLHLWELLWQAKFDYYFFSQNCSFHMMPLVELARPSLSLSENFGIVVTPPNTIKAYLSNKGLVRNIKYRPSLYSKIQQRLTEMQESERDIFYNLLDSKETTESLSDDLVRKDLILDTLLDSYRYKKMKNKYSDQDKLTYKKYLMERSRLEFPTYQIDETLAFSTRPEESHSLQMLGWGVGSSSLGNYSELKYRFVQHDLMNSDLGFVPNSDLIMGMFSLRYYASTNKLTNDKITLIRATSLNPYNKITGAFSYHIEISFDSVMYRKEYSQLQRDLILISQMDHSQTFTQIGLYSYSKSIEKESEPFKIYPFNLEGYMGRTYQNQYNSFWKDFSISFLGGAKLQPSGYFENSLRMGPGLLSYLTYSKNNFKLMVSSGVFYYQLSDNYNDFRNQIILRYNLNRDLEIRAEVSEQRYFKEALFSCVYHF